MFKGFIVGALVICFLAVPVHAHNYNIDYWTDGVTGTPSTVNMTAFYASGVSDVKLYLTSFGAFNVTGTYATYFYSPIPTNYAIASGTIVANNSCLYLGQAHKNFTTALVENEVQLVHTATYGKSHAKAHYEVETSQRYLTISTTGVDTDGFASNVVGVQACNLGGGGGATTVSAEYSNAVIGGCLNNNVDKIEPTIAVPASCGLGGFEGFYFVIFNSSQGNLSYSSSFSGQISAVTKHMIYKFDTPASVTTLCSNNAICVGNTLLDKDELYVYAVNGDYAYGITKNTPLINLTLDIATPNYVCGSYTDCDEGTGTQQRTCVDEYGFQPDRIDVDSCAIIVLENATFGFEAFTRISDVYKCVPDCNIILGCRHVINLTYRDTPTNWTITENTALKRDFLKMSQDWSTEGSRSLKMWYIPPKDGEVMSATECGNSTSGIVPSVYQNISNDTLSVRFNVTFPAENMLLRFDVKGCEKQHEQYDDYGGLLWSDVDGVKTWIIAPNFYARCYANDCDSVPASHYVLNILDTVTGLSVLGSPYFKTASIYRADPVMIDISNMGIIAGRVYSVVLAVYPDNLDSRAGNCVYFDNLRYEKIAVPLIDSVLNGVCESDCVGEHFYEALKLSNGECSVKQVAYGCAGSEVDDALNAGLDACLDANTLVSINPQTKLPYEINCPNGCNNGACGDVGVVSEASLYDCVLGDFCNPLGAFGVFLSIFMIVNYIAILFGVAVLTITKGDNPLYAGIVTVIILLGAFAGGIYPVEIGVTIIALIALAVALFFGAKLTGRG